MVFYMFGRKKRSMPFHGGVKTPPYGVECEPDSVRSRKDRVYTRGAFATGGSPAPHYGGAEYRFTA